jgi:hypothetical protein
MPICPISAREFDAFRAEKPDSSYAELGIGAGPALPYPVTLSYRSAGTTPSPAFITSGAGGTGPTA